MTRGADQAADGQTVAERAIDAPVCLAFQLGWDMSCLYHQARIRTRPPSFEIDQSGPRKTYPKLPAQSDFSGALRTERRLRSVSAGLYRLTGAFERAGFERAGFERAGFERAGFERPDVSEVEAAFETGADRDALKERVFQLHTTVLIRLQAADARLGSAYNLGRALVATSGQR